MTSPLPRQITRTGFPGTINTLQTKLWGPGVTPSTPLPLIQSWNSILCPLEALRTAQASSPSSPAPACLFPLQDRVSSGGPLGGTQGSILRGSSLDQHSPVLAPGCAPLFPWGPHPGGLFQPNPITAKSGKLSPWKGKARFHGLVPKGIWVPLAS